jgi:hypothetical protein
MYYFNYVRRANYYRNIKPKNKNLSTFAQYGGGGGGGNGGNGPNNYFIPLVIGLFFYVSTRK